MTAVAPASSSVARGDVRAPQVPELAWRHAEKIPKLTIELTFMPEVEVDPPDLLGLLSGGEQQL